MPPHLPAPDVLLLSVISETYEMSPGQALVPLNPMASEQEENTNRRQKRSEHEKYYAHSTRSVQNRLIWDSDTILVGLLLLKIETALR